MENGDCDLARKDKAISVSLSFSLLVVDDVVCICGGSSGGDIVEGNWEGGGEGLFRGLMSKKSWSGGEGVCNEVVGDGL